MKKIIKIYIAIIASVCLFMSLPADIYAVVIDVSSYNGFIQWDNMKTILKAQLSVSDMAVISSHRMILLP